MDLQTKQQVSRLCSYWKASGLLGGIFVGSVVTRILGTTQGSPAVIAWRVVEFLCLLGGVALVLLARNKYDALTGEGPGAKRFLPHA